MQELPMALTPVQLAAREGRMTASRVACLMTGDAVALLNLWRELVGDPKFVPDDLSNNWAVRLGEVTESLQLDWWERKRNPVSRRGFVVEHDNGWAACTLDGWSDVDCCPIECKHVGGFEKLETIISRYQPQMHWQMFVTGAAQCALSVIAGAAEPVVEFIPLDVAYSHELVQRAENFMDCVWALRPPVAVAPVAPPVKAERIYDFARNNQWCAEAATWVLHHKNAKDFVAAEKALKALVPADAARVVGGGIECKRNRAGSLSLKECE